ncbi:MAG: hypothetical protein QME42_02910 [bacterium]|nr:hypothetical protein [bacterium]
MRMKAQIYKYCKRIAHFFPIIHFLYKRVTAEFQHSKKIAYSFMAIIPIIGNQFKKKIIEDLGSCKGMRFWLKSLFNNNEKEENFLSSLSTNDLVNAELMLFKLVELQKEKIREFIDRSKKTIAICFPTQGYRAHVGNIINKLRNRGYNVFTLLGEVCNYDCEQKKDVFYIPNNMLSNMDFIDVFISTQVGPFDHIKVKGKVVHFFHDIHDSPLPDIEYHYKIVLGIDYYFLSSRFLSNRLKHLISVGKQRFLANVATEKEICLIMGGYPKLDRNLEYFEKHRQKANAIVYAPTMPPGKWMKEMEGIVVTFQHSDEIIKAILDNFTEYDLIFRPHPHSLCYPEIQSIVNKYNDYDKFIFDDNVDFYMYSYSRAALMVTDMSGTAYTYAFTTLRPVVFFQHNEAETMRIFGTYQYFIDRSIIGYVVQNVDGMLDKIKILIANKDEFSLRIKEYRNSSICNVGKSEDYFAENIEYIIEGKRNPDWIYL